MDTWINIVVFRVVLNHEDGQTDGVTDRQTETEQGGKKYVGEMRSESKKKFKLLISHFYSC